MKSKTVATEVSAEWQERIRQAQAHSGGFAAYCREVGLAEHRLYYWRKKLGTALPQRRPRPSKPTAAFVPVQLLPDPEPDVTSPFPLPDPKWVAELIRHLAGSPSTSPAPLLRKGNR